MVAEMREKGNLKRNSMETLEGAGPAARGPVHISIEERPQSYRMKTFRAILLFVGVLIVVPTTFVIRSAIRTRQDAKMVLDALEALGVSTNPNNSFDSFQWRYGRGRFKYGNGCTMHFCTYEVDISNDGLAELHLAPFTEMRAWFTVDRGQLILVLVEYRCAQEGTEQSGCSYPARHLRTRVRSQIRRASTRNHAALWNGLVEFNLSASQTERDAALALNLDCFSRIGGCKDITELLAAVWQRTGPDKVTSKLLGLSQRLEESHGSPSDEDF